MTQEEQKMVEEFTKMNLTKKALYHFNDMQDAFLIGLFKGEKMQLSLPSNLDEAAEKYAKENCENYVDEEDGVTYIEEALRNTFKAGAEWQMQQFQEFIWLLMRPEGYFGNKKD